MTIREAFSAHYPIDDLTPRSVARVLHDLNSWERLTDNPPVDQITNETAERFRAAAIAAGLSPRTVNARWQSVRAILRRLGPPDTGNPWGLNIITRVPAMRPVKTTHKLPRRVDLRDISVFYVACQHATAPKTGIPAPDWWRCLIVLAFTTGLRREDLFRLRFGDISIERREIRFIAGKTRKGSIFPLHDAAIAHLQRIWSPDAAAPVFRNPSLIRGGRLSRYWRAIEAHAKGETFRLHDLRRTGASEVERVRHGMGARFLQHLPRTVTDSFYVNASEELREAVESMRLPVGFNSGPKMTERNEAKRRAESLRLDPQAFTPFVVIPAEWQFRPGAFAFRGVWYAMTGLRLRALRALASAPHGVTKRGLCEAVYRKPTDASERTPVPVLLAALRDRLRRCFGLPDSFNPVPCLDRGRNGEAVWSLFLPTDLNRSRDAG